MPIHGSRHAWLRLAAVGLLGLIALVPACGWFGQLIDARTDAILGGIQRLGVDPGPPVYTPESFVNWESPHVSPLALSPDGLRLFAVNTPAARLEAFDVADETLTPVRSIPVGLDPVTVRARSRNEAWVANFVSDSVSIVDVDRGIVIRTLHTEDEPTDIAFSENRAFVVCRQRNLVQVFDLLDLSRPPQSVPVAGLHPRAAAMSPDGRTLYVAIFESGNGTTLVREQHVSDPDGPYGGQNPIPDLAGGFDPAAALEASTAAPRTGLIVRQDRSTGRWLDSQGADWSGFITWGIHGHDIAAIDTQTLAVSYVRDLMTLNMHLAVRPDGILTIVGTEAANQIRFEPQLAGKFVRSRLAVVRPDAPEAPTVLELNPHLLPVYDSPVRTLPPGERALSIADPRAITWSNDGARGYVAGMGSNNVAVIDAVGSRVATFDVGQGPTGLALDEERARLYVLNRFDATLQAVDLDTLTSWHQVQLNDPTPEAIRRGRPFLYNARLTSGLGVTACGACHVDGRMDQLAWDLGAPGDPIRPFDQVCDDLASGQFPNPPMCADFHPVKGPMITQTLQGIIGTEPLHWRGDRADLSDFNHAFLTLNGNDRLLTDAEMSDFKAFVKTIEFPPNPNRNLDNSLKDVLGSGNPRRGREIYIHEPIDTAVGRLHGASPLVRRQIEEAGPILACNRCHQLPSGTNGHITTRVDLNAPQDIKVPQLRNMHEKAGFDRHSMDNPTGFGFAHDGASATLEEFFGLAVFDFGEGDEGMQRTRDVIAFLNSLSVDAHAGTGLQITLDASNAADPGALQVVQLMMDLADRGEVGCVAHGLLSGAVRGLAYRGQGAFQADGAGETWTVEQLTGRSAAGEPMTWTLVPLGSQDRLAFATP